jgi:DNA-binding transcriptional LysR family regulator
VERSLRAGSAVKLRQLQCLCAVVDAGFNISRAAAVLFATQPAISKQLRQFEEELNLELILREAGRPVALTEAGEQTLVWARRALQASENIRALAREGRVGETGTISLATSHAHARYLLLPAITAFNQRFPKVRITVQQSTPQEAAQLVRDGKTMVGITHEPPELPKGVFSVPFLISQRALITLPDHPLLEEESLTLAKISEYPLILHHSTRPVGPRILERLRQAGLEVNLAVEAINADVAKSYVAAGLGVGIVAGFCFSTQNDPGLRARDVGHLFDPAISVVMLRKQSMLQKFTYRFLEYLHPSLEHARLEALVLDDSHEANAG